MRIKIVVQSWENRGQGDDPFKVNMGRKDTQIWSGEWEITTEGEYIAKVSILAEGQEHPICDIPFAIDVGHWQWVPPMIESDPFGALGEPDDNGDNDRSDSGPILAKVEYEDMDNG